MVGVDMKGLIDKCNNFCTQTLHTAAGLTVNRGHYEVTFEHFLLACMEDSSCDIAIAMHHFGADVDALKKALNKALEEFQKGNPARPVFSPLLQEVLEAAWLVTSIDINIARIRSGAILLAFLRRPSLYAQGQYSSILSVINREELAKNFAKIAAASTEDSGPQIQEASASRSSSIVSEDGESFIAKFCEDFTAKASKGGMDPVFGRDNEIRSMINILARRRKNNPILVGEPGVGKTAVMEGLALRITEGDVPDTLKGVTLLGLDMGLLEAGASMKGEFERRLKGVLDEIKASASPIILFIDEAHLLVGAGNSAGGSDAANLMKPALARGEIRTCAATTWKEYKKYFEKDPALARRFQLVALDEPSVSTATLILRGLRDSYERSHNVLIRDDAMEAAASYSARYISGRFLPDKAVDLLDTACARVKVGLAAKPANLEDLQREIQADERERNALERDKYNGVAMTKESVERLQHLEGIIADKKEQEVELFNAWQKELEAAKAVLEARENLRLAREEEAKLEAAAILEKDKEILESQSDSTNDPITTDQQDSTDTQKLSNTTESKTESKQEIQGEAEAILTVEKAMEILDEKTKIFEEIQGEEPLISIEVNPDTIGFVVSDWTGIPVGKMAQDQASMIADLGNVLTTRIKGQKAAINAVVEGIQASKAGLRPVEQPIGIFLLVGPSGVGKTETGLCLADALFGDESSIITVNMSEFQEKHTVSRLIGSPPGYVGYGEGGLLTEAVRRKPYSIVLLDEVEKAHPDVMQLFYQVFDKGVLTDGEGTIINFKNTAILLTSNLASDITQELCKDGVPNKQELLDAIRPTLSKHFQPALLARMSIVPYGSLQPEALAEIAELKLKALAKRLHDNNRIELTWHEAVVQTLIARCSEVETGARNIDYILASTILPQMSKKILGYMTDGNMPSTLRLDFDEEGTMRMLVGGK